MNCPHRLAGRPTPNKVVFSRARLHWLVIALAPAPPLSSDTVSLTDLSGKTIQAEVLWKGDTNVLVNKDGLPPVYIPFERLSESSRKEMESLPSGWQNESTPPIEEPTMPRDPALLVPEAQMSFKLTVSPARARGKSVEVKSAIGTSTLSVKPETDVRFKVPRQIFEVDVEVVNEITVEITGEPAGLVHVNNTAWFEVGTTHEGRGASIEGWEIENVGLTGPGMTESTRLPSKTPSERIFRAKAYILAREDAETIYIRFLNCLAEAKVEK